MGKLTTHVLDTANGRPGAGIKVELFALSGDTRRALKTTLTNDDGRCDEPLLQGDAFVAGEYELVFGAGDYFASIGTQVPEPRFVDRVVLRFGIADAAAHYHVPLLVSPWSYSTYRGS
ncbi:hydroxyisourate hydrolase [bacterium M00.F.Ca.ET.228.01.1.1]|uniref:5-hydroxyisourate hydrolase n=1 Tax=Burkholderia sp. (strain CCGE1003) TaxID=640512 RepID=E1T9Z8_BURSG|nr:MULTISPECIES: hydroxyisourate hydrolase [Burkholderiaceae]MBW9133329.1 hydroxyisourate hydrolase [Paraburkholderia ginsengiterrae]TGP42318.1 hydroxyisourate hydrolase [bacterium M00.F.Ca.ET.228.01.1.1]TGR99967.1 hydroxyisourate hydrolase [bacterium M00.F.Ca.ET.191.01.1.1]TGU04288.1 hydroxyisourate hydrolase [bacterium M00.F.Ca.ET.155.01.1.1]MBW0451171.1 hydroxyisourate hydrolase [Paraburkholderia phenoliruptrix]